MTGLSNALRFAVIARVNAMSMNENAIEREAVREANEQFYQALEQANLELMSAVWLHADWVKCVHPGWDLIVGWDQVRKSWQQIFEGNTGMRVAATDVQITIEGDFALVSCYEMLAVFLDNERAPVSVRTTATNLFQRAGGDWKMIHHHASQVPDAPLVNDSFATGDAGSDAI